MRQVRNTPYLPARRLWPVLALVAWLAAIAPTGAVLAGNGLYYRIGGASPIIISSNRGYTASNLGLGIYWDIGSACSRLNPMLTVSNQLNGITNGFQQLMGNIIQTATAAVASLPALIIQHAAPGLYDLLTNGVLQGRLDFREAMTSCQEIVREASDVLTASGWFHQAQAQNWSRTASRTNDAVDAQKTVGSQGGNEGVVWVGGQRYGGINQPAINIIWDTAMAGFNMLHGRTNPTSIAPVPGGGGGWGSMPTTVGTWPGTSLSPPTSYGGGCGGGMCTVWDFPTEAADWIVNVVGDKTIQTCSGCEKIRTITGIGLIRAVEKQKEAIAYDLAALVVGAIPINSTNLRKVSAGPGFAVSRDVIKVLQSDPEKRLLINRLASEMALARTLTQAMWARRVLLAGASEPGIANNALAQEVINRKLDHLDRDIQSLMQQMKIRKTLASNAPIIALGRERGRDNASAVSSRLSPKPNQLESKGHIEP